MEKGAERVWRQEDDDDADDDDDDDEVLLMFDAADVAASVCPR